MKTHWPWVLALAAVAAGYIGWGWPGVVLALTVVVFWLLLQFNRALRAMRNAASRPKGHVDSAVMLHSKLQAGMRLAQLMQISGSFGDVPAAAPRAASGVLPGAATVADPARDESYCWTDTSGASVTVQLRDGKVSAWTLQRGA